MNPPLARALQLARRAEKEQALFYRALSAQAEQRGDVEQVEGLNGLLADEQHHLSRLTARLLEADQPLLELNDVHGPAVDYADWRNMARAREQAEIDRYQTLLQLAPDPTTRALVEEILDVEKTHARHLGGKYMTA